MLDATKITKAIVEEMQAQDLVLLPKALFASKLDEIARLRASLQRIADWCPATQEITLAHQMAQEAEETLADAPHG